VGEEEERNLNGPVFLTFSSVVCEKKDLGFEVERRKRVRGLLFLLFIF